MKVDTNVNLQLVQSDQGNQMLDKSVTRARNLLLVSKPSLFISIRTRGKCYMLYLF